MADGSDVVDVASSSVADADVVIAVGYADCFLLYKQSVATRCGGQRSPLFVIAVKLFPLRHLWSKFSRLEILLPANILVPSADPVRIPRFSAPQM